MSKDTPTCVRCSKEYSDFPALSRRDNKTNICSDCGTMEAFEDAGMAPKYDGPRYWSSLSDLEIAEEEETNA